MFPAKMIGPNTILEIESKKRKKINGMNMGHSCPFVLSFSRARKGI